MPEFTADQIKKRDLLKNQRDKIKKRLAVYRNDKEKMKKARNNDKKYARLRKKWEQTYKEYRKFLSGPRMHGNVWVSLREWLNSNKK